MNLQRIFEYYSREDVQEILFRISRNREVVGVFKNGSYGTRPNTLIYSNDILAMVREGAVEFHCSLERWSQPMSLKENNYSELRIGWDLILDLDCEIFEHGKIAAKILGKALKIHGIKGFSIKFTGGTGFHLGIPWECFPKTINYQSTVKLFPEIPRIIGLYLKEFIKEKLESTLLQKYTPETLSEQTGRQLKEILSTDENQVIDPFKIVEIDPVLISPRHLFRMPYSLNRTTGLVSLPIPFKNIDSFERKQAEISQIKVNLGFLDQGNEGEAELLVSEALDWWMKKRRKEEIRKETKKMFLQTKKIPESMFPPCIKKILKGLSDGRKRSIFILITFMRSLGWNWDEIENKLWEWNSKNKPPLRENYIRTQLRWHKQQKRSLLPPTCKKEGWYDSFGICEPDHVCGSEKSIKNPLNYPFKIMGAKRKKPL